MKNNNGRNATPASANAVPDDFDTIEGNKKVPAVKREALGAGARLVYLRTQRTPDRTEPGKENVLHIFTGRRGVEFALWSMAQLDARLATVPEGSVCFVRYDGVEAHPTKRGKTIAVWCVAVPKAGTKINAITLADEYEIDPALEVADDDDADEGAGRPDDFRS